MVDKDFTTNMFVCLVVRSIDCSPIPSIAPLRKHTITAFFCEEVRKLKDESQGYGYLQGDYSMQQPSTPSQNLCNRNLKAGTNQV